MLASLQKKLPEYPEEMREKNEKIGELHFLYETIFYWKCSSWHVECSCDNPGKACLSQVQ